MSTPVNDRDNRRVAIFQAQYPVTSQTLNAAIMLSGAGYEVELFLYNTWNAWRYVELEQLRKHNGVQVYDLHQNGQAAPSDVPNMTRGVQRRARAFLRRTVPALSVLRAHGAAGIRNTLHAYRLARGSHEGLLPKGIVLQAIQMMERKSYRCLIGVEKNGLIWAGQVAERLRAPVVYYSSELYTDDYQRVVGGRSIAFRRLRMAERAYHRKAAATIVQDPERARVLFDENRVSLPEATVFYVPVSLLGGPYRKSSKFLRSALGIPNDQKVILYFGNIWERRGVVELAQAAQSFPDRWVLVMHGEVYDDIAERIRAVDERNRIVISRELVPSERIQELVASADLGLAFYSYQTLNEQLTAFSSEKIALYMQCGVPFVAYDYPGYRRLADEDGCGVVIRDLSRLPEVIARILESHNEFRSRAYQAFDRHYDFTRNFAQVIQGIDRLGPVTV